MCVNICICIGFSARDPTLFLTDDATVSSLKEYLLKKRRPLRSPLVSAADMKFAVVVYKHERSMTKRCQSVICVWSLAKNVIYILTFTYLHMSLLLCQQWTRE